MAENDHPPLTWNIALTTVYALTCYTVIDGNYDEWRLNGHSLRATPAYHCWYGETTTVTSDLLVPIKPVTATSGYLKVIECTKVGGNPRILY